LILLAWGDASWFFQRRLAEDPDRHGVRLGWWFVDVGALCLLIQFDDALMSPLTVAFPILIAASALSARADQVLWTTLFSGTGYLLLVFAYRLAHSDIDRSYRHIHCLVGLALLGLMLAYQANRTRALARICGDRD
jgi:hypothetical protein